MVGVRSCSTVFGWEYGVEECVCVCVWKCFQFSLQFGFFMVYTSNIPCCYFNLFLDPKLFSFVCCICRLKLFSPAIILELMSICKYSPEYGTNVLQGQSIGKTASFKRHQTKIPAERHLSSVSSANKPKDSLIHTTYKFTRL